MCLLKPENRTFKPTYDREMLLMLCAPALMAVYFYGIRALCLIILGVLLSQLVSALCDRILGKKVRFISPGAAVTGLLTVLMLPASSSWTLAAVAVLFAFAVACLPFGNGSKTPFVPAAAGIAFVTVCRTSSVFTYPFLLYDVVAKNDPDFTAGTSLASMLRSGSSVYGSLSSVTEVFIGDYSGAMGTGCALVLLVVPIYLLVKHKDRFLIYLGYITAVVVFAALFPRILTGSLISVVMELCAGAVLFGGVFLLTAPCGSPRKPTACLLYGITGGIVVMLFNRYGVYEDCTCFAVLIMNALCPLFGRKKAKEVL